MKTLIVKPGSEKTITLRINAKNTDGSFKYPVDEWEFYMAVKDLDDVAQNDTGAKFVVTGANKDTTNNTFTMTMTVANTNTLSINNEYKTDILFVNIADTSRKINTEGVIRISTDQQITTGI